MERVHYAVTSTVERVGPEEARAFMAQLLRNRPLRWKKIEKYADDMRAGKWYVGPAVYLDWFDRFIDGAHRMEAIIKSDATVEVLVVRGVDPNSRSAMDDGVKRMFSDDLAMSGYAGAHEAAALMRKIAYWEEAAERNEGRGGLAHITRFTISRTQLNDKWSEYEKDISAALKMAHKWKSNWPGNTGALSFMAWLLTKEENNPETVARYFNIITQGSQDPADRPLLQLRRILTGDISRYREDRGERGSNYDVFFMIRAWNAWVKHEKLARFTLGPGGLTDPYPKLQRTR